MSKTVLTGLRANGEFHIGNYLGSMQAMANLQSSLEEGDKLNMFVADLHSFTTPIDHSELYENVIQNIRMYVAAGLDPSHADTIVYRQSFVPAHAQLAWILNCFTYYGEVNRMVEFKDKSERLGHKAVSVGLLDYPVLMAADILLYGASYVPLGDDQKQHMELVRTVAERFNNQFSEIFEVPKSWDEQLKFTDRESVRIRSLAHPETKMSKSIDDPRGTIMMLDSPSEAHKKIMSAETDSLGEINYDFQKQPGVSNLISLLAHVTEKQVDEAAAKWQGQSNYGDLKKTVAEAIERFLSEFQQKFEGFSAEDAEAILIDGEQKANIIAESKLQEVLEALGLRRGSN